jgi:hypothetical protein
MAMDAEAGGSVSFIFLLVMTTSYLIYRFPDRSTYCASYPCGDRNLLDSKPYPGARRHQAGILKQTPPENI